VRFVGGIAKVETDGPETVVASDVIDLANAVSSVFTVGFRRGRVWNVYWVNLYPLPESDNGGCCVFRSKVGSDGFGGYGTKAYRRLLFGPRCSNRFRTACRIATAVHLLRRDFGVQFNIGGRGHLARSSPSPFWRVRFDVGTDRRPGVQIPINVFRMTSVEDLSVDSR